MRSRICVLIAVYNHGTTLRAVVCAALEQGFAVLVVDDGSTDHGAETLQNLPITLLSLPKNQGKGWALCMGAAKAKEEGYSHIITMDADGQHLACDLLAFCEQIRATPYALIVGARDFSKAPVPWASRFGRTFSWFWMLVQTGIHVDDVQSGYRAYPLKIFDCLTLREKGYAFEIEVLVKAAWAGFEIRTIPVAVRYPKDRISHFKIFSDNLRISLLNARLTIRALLPIPFKRHALEAEGGISLRSPLKSLRTLLKTTTPATLAKSAGVSLCITTLPLLGLQSILLLLAIGQLRLNRLCALVLIPLTWPPLVPGLAVLVGYRLRHGRWLAEFSLQTLGYEAWDRFLEWILGSICLAPLLGLCSAGCIFILAQILSRKRA